MAHTYSHQCVDASSISFSCPGTASHSLTLGSLAGSLTIDDTENMPAGTPSSGAFGVQCRSCGFGTPTPVDLDGREGHIKVELEFGPNVFNNSVKEALVQGYRIYAVDSCQKKYRLKDNSALDYIEASQTMENRIAGTLCECPTHLYRSTIELDLTRRQAVLQDLVFMIAVVLDTGYELPVGIVTAPVADAFTTTGTTTSVTTTSRTDTTITGTSITATGTTTSVTATTTFTTIAPTWSSMKIAGYFESTLSCSFAASYASDPQVKSAWLDSIAEVSAAPKAWVQVFVRNYCARRLSESLRRLNVGRVRVEYIITVPPGSTIQTRPAQEEIVEKLTSSTVVADMQQKVTQKVSSSTYTNTNVVTFSQPTQIANPTPQPTTLAPAAAAEDEPNDVSVLAIALGTLGMCLGGVICCIVSIVFGKRRREGSEGAEPSSQM